ncbi:hypothetical protein IBX73_01310 [candidate division WOR-3 bacterium]|nr:hypothetical protein [candidate division WOR-3 bacterium]
MELHDLIRPLGIISYSLMLFAALTGARVITLRVKQHKLIGLAGLIGATAHAALVVYFNYF